MVVGGAAGERVGGDGDGQGCGRGGGRRTRVLLVGLFSSVELFSGGGGEGGGGRRNRTLLADLSVEPLDGTRGLSVGVSVEWLDAEGSAVQSFFFPRCPEPFGCVVPKAR